MTDVVSWRLINYADLSDLTVDVGVVASGVLLRDRGLEDVAQRSAPVEQAEGGRSA